MPDLSFLISQQATLTYIVLIVVALIASFVIPYVAKHRGSIASFFASKPSEPGVFVHVSALIEVGKQEGKQELVDSAIEFLKVHSKVVKS